MKIFLFLTLLFASPSSWATCTSPISRVNNSANAVLTSTKYNTDHNNAYNKINDLEGSCITDGTVTAAKLDTSTLGPLTNGVQRGCEVTRASVSSLSVGDCFLSVNGNMVQTSTATTVSFGCSGCAAEATNTKYFLYVKSDSDGTTLGLSIETTAPADSTGYDSSNNLVIGRFYNDGGNDIDQYSIDQYRVNQFVPQNTDWIDDGTIIIGATTTAPTKPTVVDVDKVYFRRVGKNMEMRFEYFADSLTGSAAGSGDYLILVPNSSRIDLTTISEYTTVETTSAPSWRNIQASNFFLGECSSTSACTTGDINVRDMATVYDATQFRVHGFDYNNAISPRYHSFSSDTVTLGNTNNFHGFVSVPIEGWSE